MRSSSCPERGFTLLEFSLSLALVSATLAGALAVYVQTVGEGNVGDYLAYHSSLEVAVKAAWQDGKYESISTETAAGMFASNARLVENGELRGPRGVVVDLEPRSLPGKGINRHFAVVYADVSPSVCTSLVMGLLQRIELAEVGGEVVYRRNTPVDLEALNQACSATGKSLAVVPVN